jgi:misacylated tRNA(Ala) deacylase
MSELRYLPDAEAVTEFEATVTEATEEAIVLDGTYFYPEGGGQPPDYGTITWDNGEAIIEHVRKDHGDVRHEIGTLVGDPPAPGTTVEGHVDAERRAALRRMHTAQHVVSRVVLDAYGATTAGNQIYADRSRIDFEPAEFDETDIERIEREANAAIEADYRVTKEERPRDIVEAETDEGRALLDLIPDSVDPLRVVEIEDYDLCPCGGTHVNRTGAIGEIVITDTERKGADTERITFELRAP